MGRWPVLIVAAILTTCGIQDLPTRLSSEIGTGQVYALHGLEGRWAGTVQSGDPSCTSANGLMTIRGDKFAFDPFQSTMVIHGTINKLGRLQGALSRAGGDNTTLSATFDANATTDEDERLSIVGVLKSGRCRWTVRLLRQ